MATTTIRIEEELKARIAAAARLAGKPAHAFILDAIAQTVEQVETDAEISSFGRRALGQGAGHGEDLTVG